MAPISTQTPHNQPYDELDDILNGIVHGTEIPPTNAEQPDSSRPGVRNSDAAGALGIDEEVVITKKRIPAPKLNEERLLSTKGIPRLENIAKERLHFKGKGHEYRDIARMLNMYQLWLDDLYPRAKFADALTIIEKVGHSKRMHMMRKRWIDEGRPRRTVESDDEDIVQSAGNAIVTQQNTEDMGGVEEIVPIGEGDLEREPQSYPLNPASSAARAPALDDPDEDELDALLAESEFNSFSAPKTLPIQTAPNEEDPFADEMEAMADMEDLW